MKNGAEEFVPRGLGQTHFGGHKGGGSVLTGNPVAFGTGNFPSLMQSPAPALHHTGAPNPNFVQLTGVDQQDRNTIVQYFVDYLASLSGATCPEQDLVRVWNADPTRAAAGVRLYGGGIQNLFHTLPRLFRCHGHPPRVTLIQSSTMDSRYEQQAEDELLSVATSMASTLFESSPGPTRPPRASSKATQNKVSIKTTTDETSPVEVPLLESLPRGSRTDPLSRRSQTSSDFVQPRRVTIGSSSPTPEKIVPIPIAGRNVSEKTMLVSEIVARLKPSDGGRKKDDLGSELVKENRVVYDRICEMWGSLQNMLQAYPDLFEMHGEGSGREMVQLRRSDSETKAMEKRRTILEAVSGVLRDSFSVMHPDDLREELHRSMPLVMGQIANTYGSFTKMLEQERAVFDVVQDPQPLVRLRWPGYCSMCGVWPETPEACQGHLFSDMHQEMRKSVIPLKENRDPDRWLILRMVEERIRRNGGSMKLGNVPNFGKHRPMFATRVRTLFGGFKQLVECNPRFKLKPSVDGSDPVVTLVDDWRKGRLEGVVIRVKQKDTLIWIRPDSNPKIEFFLHRDRSLGGREIANSPAFIVPRVGDRMSFLPSDVPADPNPFAEGAVVLERVPDFRVRFYGTCFRDAEGRYLVRGDMPSSGGLSNSAPVFEVIWRDDASRMAVDAGHPQVNFVRSSKQQAESDKYPWAVDVTVDSPQMPSPRHGSRPLAGSMGVPSYGSRSNHRNKKMDQMPSYSLGGRGPMQMQQMHMHHMHHMQPAHMHLPQPALQAPQPGQRTSLRHGTWPAVYVDPNAAPQPTSGGDSGGSSGERTPIGIPSGNDFSFHRQRSEPMIWTDRRNKSSQMPVQQPPQQKHQQLPQTAQMRSPRTAGHTKQYNVKLNLDDDQQSFAKLLPESLHSQVFGDEAKIPYSHLVSVTLDAGRAARMTYSDGSNIRSRERLSLEQVQQVATLLGSLEGRDAKCFENSLHRGSVLYDPLSKQVTGCTLVVGRSVEGIADALGPLVKENQSVLLVGPSHSGKTSLLRDMARLFSGESHDMNVLVVDAGGEMGGDSMPAHISLGDARVLRTLNRSELAERIEAAVEGHKPEVLVADQISSNAQVDAVLGARHKGVAVFAATGCSSLLDLASSHTLSPLVGVSATGRSVISCPFDVVIEVESVGIWTVHSYPSSSVDAAMSARQQAVKVTKVRIDPEGKVTSESRTYPSRR